MSIRGRESIIIRIICCLMLSTAFTHLRAQNPGPDLSDTTVISQLIAQSNTVRLFNEDSSVSILLTALEKSKAINYNKGIFITLNKLGSAAQIRGDHEKAVGYLLQVLPYAQIPQNRRNLNVVYNNIGLSYSSLGKYDQALTFFHKALDILSKERSVTNKTDSIGIYTNIGILWCRLQEYSYALHTFRLAGSIAERKKDTVQMAVLYQNLAEVYYIRKEWSQAETYNRKALQYATQRSIAGLKVSALTGLAQVYEKTQRYAEALVYLNKALAIADTTRIPAYAITNLRATMGAVYLSMKDYPRAKPLLLTALAEARQTNHQELQQLLEPMVARVLASTGSYQEAYRHQLNYSTLKDILFEQEKARSLEVWMNSRIAEKDKAMLTQQLYITRQKNQLEQKNLWIGGTILAAMLVLSISFALLRHYKHKQTIQQSFIYQLQQQQQIDLLKAQVHGEEQEQQRIARDLHDNIASQLWAVKLNVDSMRQRTETDEAQAKKLNTIYSQLTDATRDIRKTAHNLMPDLLLEEGLASAIALICEKTAEHTQLEVDFQEYGLIPRMDKEIELTIYRMVQELIQNVMKHARDATQLLVQLSCVDTLLNITVEDNGTAFKERPKEEGTGLRQIRKRTHALKGHFDLQSIPGKGTTAYIEFDMQHFL